MPENLKNGHEKRQQSRKMNWRRTFAGSGATATSSPRGRRGLGNRATMPGPDMVHCSHPILEVVLPEVGKRKKEES